MKTFPFGFTGFLIAALALGVLGDWLLRVGLLGINVTVWAIVVLALVAWCAPRAGVLSDRSARAPLAAAVFFCILYAWRDAEPLKVLLVFVIIGSVALTTAAAAGRSIRRAYVFDYAVDGLSFGLGVVALPIALLSRPRPPAGELRGSVAVPLFAVLRGVLLAAPFLVFFGILLVSADAMFEQLVGDLFDVERLASHLFLTGFFAWAAAATWWLCLESTVRVPERRAETGRAWLGGIEVNVALGLIALLFIAFIAVQARYFFGGHEHVLSAAGLTYADYARRGFFELAWVAAFSLALLVVCSQMMQSAGQAGRRVYKVIAAVLVASLLLIIASAFHRMSLYIEAYGLTRLRLYVACFLVWMLVVFLWLYVTIFRERIHHFAWGFLLSGYAATFLLVAINPDARVARVNMDRAAEGLMLATANASAGLRGGSLDTQYIGELSADAIPVITSRFEDMSPAVQAILRAFLEERTNQYHDRPLRTWTLGLYQARTVLQKFDPGPDSINP